MTWARSHAKLLAAVAGGATTAAVSVWGTSSPWVQIAVLAATAAGVYRVPNTTKAA